MTVVGPNTKKKKPSKRNPGANKSDGTKPHIQPPNKRKKPTPPLKSESDWMPKKQKPPASKKRKPTPPVKAPKKPKPTPPIKAPEKPTNKRTGQDYRDWADLRDRIRANEEKKRKGRRTLPGRI